MRPPKDIAEKIQGAFAKFIADPKPLIINFDPPLGLRKIAAELRLLPVMLDWGGCFAIRSEGQIFSFLWDSPRDLRPEYDPRTINMFFYQASQKYPELSELRPQKPDDTQLCPHCKGTGDLLFGMDLNGTDLSNQTNNFVCYCGNLGWLPPNYKTS
jgi:hypothetical protein